MISRILQKEALSCAMKGLDFFLRTQIPQANSADGGRYINIANIRTGETISLTTNWLTGIICSTMLDVWRQTQDARYLKSAELAHRYLFSLQDTAIWHERTYGAIHEIIPQCEIAYPRDGLSAATGMLDYAIIARDEESLRRAVLFGEWFIRICMESGYPYWAVCFDETPWKPFWHGSFHSGSAFFLTRLYKATGRQEFLNAARRILDFYNDQMLSDTGNITVIREHGTMKSLDNDTTGVNKEPVGWVKMHQYNDDFGTLANLTVGMVTGEKRYTDKAMLFLNRVKNSQRADGGFGPDEWKDSIPNAAGMILIELMAAKYLGLANEDFDATAEAAARYLTGLQITDESNGMQGAFLGMSDDYDVKPDFCNARAGIYAIMALLRFAGEKSATYFPDFPMP